MQFYQRLANSNTTKKILNCIVSTAAESIVDAISFYWRIVLWPKN